LSEIIVTRPGWREVYQTDPQFGVYPEIRHSACFALTMARSLACHFGMVWNHDVFKDFLVAEWSNTHKDVDNMLYVDDIQRYLDDFIGADRVKFVGKFPADHQVGQGEFEWIWWHRDGTNFKHATQGDGKGAVAYDPWIAGGSLSQLRGKKVGVYVARLV
jgi:hypothetical protein